MKPGSLLFGFVITCLTTFSAVSGAEDIDLYLANAGDDSRKPNVLFALDNSANWESVMYQDENGEHIQKRHIIHEALHKVLTDPAYTAAIRAGLMGFTAGNSPKGGKVLAAVNDLDASVSVALDSTTSVTMPYYDYLARLFYPSGVYSFGNELLPRTNNAPDALMLNEAYHYYRGLSPRSGTQDGDHDPRAISGGNYISPFTSSGNPCGKNYIILIANGRPDSGENTDAASVLQSLGGMQNSDPVSLDPNNYESNWGDEFARFMAGTDLDNNQEGSQNIITYVIDVHDPAEVNTRPEKAAHAFLKSVARQGNGRYFIAKDVDSLVQAFIDILNELIAVNTVFAAVNLPVSVNVRGTYLNQVYMGMFRPDVQNRPRWFGNLKLYRLIRESGTDSLALADANGNPIRSSTTGFIVSSAESYWTQSSDFWTFAPRGTPESASDLPDGEVVEKGAAAQKLRQSYPSRNVYTCNSCGSNEALSSRPFNTSNSNITTSALGVADSTEREALINWVRGDDNLDEDADTLTADVRPSIHGDVLHSRPAVINFNRDGTDDDVVVFYGANDGAFRAVQGGMADSDGVELWSFIPPEFYGRLKRMRDNTAVNDTNGRKPYFADGLIGTYAEDSNGDGKLQGAAGDKVHLFVSMRRGGRFLYALDVSNPTNPKVLWKKSHTDSGYGELGQTWSEPKVALIDLNGTPTRVLIMGAGYDPAANDTVPAGTASMGRGIMVIDAEDGDLIWQAGPSPSGANTNLTVSDMTYSIPSAVKLLNRDGDSDHYADRAYVGDTGGNVWRMDFADPDPANWTVNRLASVRGSSSEPRKFLFAPDVVYNDSGGYDAVFVGSGDREHPFDANAHNRFFMFKDPSHFVDTSDPNYTPPSAISSSDLYDATDNLIQDGTDSQKAAAQADLDAADGWYVSLRSGEKVISGVVVVAGSVYFSTHEPTPPGSLSCNSLGIARSYILNFLDGSATRDWDGADGITIDDRSVELPGGGYPPSPVSVITTVDGQTEGAVIIGTWVVDQNVPSDVRWRVFWYKEME